MRSNNAFLFISAVVLALLAAFSGMIWIYYVALWVGIPCALISFLIWRKIKNDGRRINFIIPSLLIFAVIVSLVTLAYWLVNLYIVD